MPWHRSAAGLPAMTEWLAHGSGANSLERLSRELLFQAWRAIWANTHEIAVAIPALTAGSHADELAVTRSHASYASGGMQLLNDRLASQIADLDQLATKPEFYARPTPRIALVSWWQSASDVLTAPIPKGVFAAKQRSEPIPNGMSAAKQRSALVGEFRRVSRQLLVNGPTPESMPNVTPEVTRELAFVAARRRGFLLLDRLRVIDVPFQETPPLPGFPQQLATPGEKPETPEFRFNHFAFQADDRQSLAEASSRCGELLTKAIEFAGKEDDLVRAERWLRIVPAYADVSDDLLNRLRRERVRSVLAVQARRTYLDYWYGEGGTRYYRTAIERLAGDAGKLGVNSPLDPFKPYLGPESPFPVTASIPPRFIVTDEPNPELRITFARQPPTDIDGVPMFWATPTLKSETRLAVTLNPKATVPTLVRPIQRFILENLKFLFQALNVPTLVRPIPRLTTPLPRFPVAEGSPVQIVGFFRGRTIEKSVPVDIYRLPDRIASTGPSLTSTAIAVRADPRIRAKYGYGSGTVAVVLDCSGSLGPVDRKNPKDRGLYSTALEALDVLIHDLPPGTTLNVWVFGQRMPDAKSPEETIHEIRTPILLPGNAKDREEIFKEINDKVSGLEPWDLSPIVHTPLCRPSAQVRIQGAPGPVQTRPW